MTVSFEKPPVNEVALGYSFLARPDLLIPHIGKFWSELEDAYPHTQHAAPIVDNAETAFTDIPLPRVWFLNSDKSRLVQLQQDRLICNWRGVVAGQPYIRFPPIQEEFQRIRKLFEAYVLRKTGEPVRAAGYSLTYVNLIRSGEGWTPDADLSTVFPDQQWRAGARFLPRPSSVEWKATFQLPNEFGILSATVQPARLVREKTPIIKFELSANSGSLGGRSVELEEWLKIAHEWIVRAFEDLTSPQMHSNVWHAEKPGA